MQGIEVKIRCKNSEASWVETKNVCPCTDWVCCLARSLQARLRSSNNIISKYLTDGNLNSLEHNCAHYLLFYMFLRYDVDQDPLLECVLIPKVSKQRLFSDSKRAFRLLIIIAPLRCCEHVMIVNKRKSKALRWNRRSFLRENNLLFYYVN